MSVGDTSTATSPNSASTGGSGTSESCCQAAMDACDQLAARVAPHAGGTGWRAARAVPCADAAARATARREWRAALAAAVGGGGVGLHELAAIGVAKKRAAPGGAAPDAAPRAAHEPSFDYYTYGVVATEVEIDVLTGELCLRRCDLHMDQGTPLNAAVDMGQAEGGFVMALGYYLTEEVLWSTDAADARCLTLGTWDYKPPAAHDVPLVFNVSLLPKAPNPCATAVLGSKASGEPPMALAASALFAAREAIASARADAGVSGWFELDAPLTVERIQQACATPDSDFVL